MSISLTYCLSPPIHGLHQISLQSFVPASSTPCPIGLLLAVKAMGIPYYRTSSSLGWPRWNRAYISLYIAIAVVLSFAVSIYTPLPNKIDYHRDAVVPQIKNVTIDHSPNIAPLADTLAPPQRTNLNATGPRYAYATFLAGDSAAEPGDETLEHDRYFVATRILGYQLLHAPERRTVHDYPFIVLVTSDVSAAKRERLSRDGARVWEAPPVDPGWIKTNVSTWQNVMSKLRLWELTEFERICFVDGDTILTAPLDEIFDDPAAAVQTAGNYPEELLADEAALPGTYVFAGVPETEKAHHYPPTEEGHDWPNIDYLNASFFVLQPSLSLLDYYTSLTTLPDRFDPHLPEQNLLNYAHRREGNMPWHQLDTKWNVHYPTFEDLEGGVVSLHEKWWAPVNAELEPFLQSWRWRTEGFWEAKDALKG